MRPRLSLTATLALLLAVTVSSPRTDAAGSRRVRLSPAARSDDPGRGAGPAPGASTGSATARVALTEVYGIVNGVVRDATNGVGLANALVALSDDAGINTFTDWAGGYSLTGVPVGAHTLDVSREGFANTTSPSVSVVEGTIAAPDVSLAQSTAVLSGHVVDPIAATPLAGVTVTLARSGQTVTTDGEGAFSFADLPTGYDLAAFTLAGYQAAASNEILLTPAAVLDFGSVEMIPIPPEPTGLLHGTVRDALGAPLAGVTVTALGLPPAQTGIDGRYQIAGVPIGAYVFTAEKSGFRKAFSRWHRPAGVFSTNWEMLQDFRLEEAGTSATLEITARDFTLLTPAPGNALLFTADSAYLLVTDPAGESTVLGVPAGTLFGTIPAPTYLPAGSTVPLDVNAGGTLPAQAPLYAIGGRVHRASTGAPIPGATVTLTNEGASYTTTATTDSNGRWSFTGGPTGLYAISASAPGGLACEPVNWLLNDDGTLAALDLLLDSASDRGTLAITEPASNATLVSAPASVSVTATLPKADDYIVNAIVTIPYVEVRDAVVTYDTDGRTFHIGFTANPQNGPLTISVEAVTRHEAILSASVDVSVQMPITPLLVELIPSTVAGGESLTGIVTLNVPAPTDGLLVALTSSDPAAAHVPATVTVPEGATAAGFEVTTGLTPTATSALISATANGVTRSATLTISPSTTGSVTGFVLDGGSGIGLPDVVVTAASIQAVTDGSGAYTLPNVPIGVQTLTAARDGYAGAGVEVTVAGGVTTTAGTITLTPEPVQISGYVMDPIANAPVEGVTVTLARGGETTSTDGAGHFAFTSLSPGFELLSFSKAGYRTSVSSEVALPPAANMVFDRVEIIPIDNIPGTIHGTVRNAAGSPVDGATVTALGLGSVQTAVDGTYQMAAPVGSYLLTAEKTGHRKVFSRWHGPAGYFGTAWQVVQDFVLPAATATGSLTVGSHDIITRSPSVGAIWLYSPLASYLVRTDPAGSRTIDSMPAGTVVGDQVPFVLETGASRAVEFNAGATPPTTSPIWAAGGQVIRETTGERIAGATVTLNNPSASFTTTATSDANGRWSFASGPVGAYSVTITAPGGLALPNPWTFEAGDNGGIAEATLFLRTAADDGSLAIDTPAEGAVLVTDLASVAVTATLPRADDYILNAVVSLSSAEATSLAPTYAMDGRHATIAFGSSSPNGPITITVQALTRYGVVLTATRNVTLQKIVAPQSVTFDHESVAGGESLGGIVTLSLPAETGGLTVSLSSSAPAVAQVPASVLVPEGSASVGFPITTSLTATTTSPTISATANGVTASGSFTVTSSTTGGITGVVLDGGTGIGLPGVLVSAASVETTTDGSGAYTLGGVATGSHTLTASRSGYAQADEPVTVEGGVTGTAGTLSLTPTVARIFGNVLDPLAGVPLAGVTVTLARTGQSTATDASGHFAFEDLSPGFELVSFSKAGYRDGASAELALFPAASIEYGNVEMIPVPAYTGTLHGTVRDSLGSPVSGATVTALGLPATTTASDGTYEIVAPRIGGRVLTAEKSGYRKVLSRRHGAAEYFAVPWQVVQDFVLPDATATGSLTVNAHDVVTRDPSVGEMRLYTPLAAYLVLTDPAGTRTIASMPAGTVVGDQIPFVLGTGASRTVELTAGATPPTTSPIWAAGGQVVRETTGERIAGATVTLNNPSASFTTTVTTDANGRWSFASGPVGAYSVSITAPGGLTLANPWTFTAADNGAVVEATLFLRSPADDGSLVIDTPLEGVLSADLSSVTVSATLPRADDYIVNAVVNLSSAEVTSISPTYALDGRHATIAFGSSSPNGPVTITVQASTRYGVLLSASRSVTLQTNVGPASVTLTPQSVGGGAVVTGDVTLTTVAPAGGFVVSLSSSDPAAVVPATVTVPAGQLHATFPITTSAVASIVTAEIAAAGGGLTASATLTIGPPALATLVVSPTSLAGGSSATGTVTLNGPAPAGTVVSLSSSDASVSVPASVSIPTGGSTATFPVTTVAVPTPVAATLSAVWNGVTKTATLTVNAPALVSLVLTPTSLESGATGTGTVTISGAAPASGLVVSLSLLDPSAATVPPSVTVPAGQVSASFAVNGAVVSTPVSTTLSATSLGVTRTAALVVGPHPIAAFTLSPAQIVAGLSVTATVSLRSPAPAGGATVVLGSAQTAATVPATVVVPEGSTDATFTVTTGAPASNQVTFDLSATYGGYARTTPLTIALNPVSTVTVAPNPILGAALATGSVYLGYPAPAGGYTFTLTSSNPTAATVPPSVTVPEGATTASFGVQGQALQADATTDVVFSFYGKTWTKPVTVRSLQLWALSASGTYLVVGRPTTVYVSLSGAAPAGGFPITLTSSEPAAAPVPATLVVPAGSTSTTFTITAPASVTTDIPVTLTAEAQGVVRTLAFTAAPFGVASIDFAGASSVKAGHSVQARIVLNGPAPTGGTDVAIAVSGAYFCSYGVVTCPDTATSRTVTVPAGQTTTGSSVYTSWTGTSGSLAVTSTLDGRSRSATLPITAGTFTVAPSWSVLRGEHLELPLQFDGDVPFGGEYVTTVSSTPAVIPGSAPDTIHTNYVQPNPPQILGSYHTLPLTAPVTAESGTATLTLQLRGASTTTQITVRPTTLTALTLIPSACPPGAPGCGGTVVLDSPAPSEGAPVTLSSTNPSVASVPAGVTIPAGETKASFPITVGTVVSSTPVTLEATYGVTLQKTFRALPPGGATITGSVVDGAYYDFDPPVEGAAVALAGSDTLVGADGHFTLYADPGPVQPIITGGGTYLVEVLPSRTAGAGETVDFGLIRLRHPAGTCSPVGRVVDPSGTPIAGATLTVQGYDTDTTTGADGRYTLHTPGLHSFRVTVRASGYVDRTEDVRTSPYWITCPTSLLDFVLDPAPRPTLATFEVIPAIAHPGDSRQLRVTLTGGAPVDAKVSISSIEGDVSSALLQSNVPVSSGAVTLPGETVFTYALTPAGQPPKEYVTTYAAFYGGVTRLFRHTVLPPQVGAGAVTCSPAAVTSGETSTCTVVLSFGLAPAGGALVNLSTTDPAVATTPASVTVPEGQSSATFTVSTLTVSAPVTITVRASYNGSTAGGPLTVNPPPAPVLTGVAPGRVVAGDATLQAYGSNLDAATVRLEGPVYSLDQPDTPLCGSSLPACPTRILNGTVNVSGNALAFAIPPDVGPGYYLTRLVKGAASANHAWVAVETPEKTQAALTDDEHRYANRLESGQTITGNLTGTTTHTYTGANDFNQFYFIGTAGSRVTLSMERVDTGKTWEHPDSLDPELSVVAPDGFVYENLHATDDQPVVDLDASIVNAELPQTGIYFVTAATSKGSGPYRLHFSVDSQANAALADRIATFPSRAMTAVLGAPVNQQAIVLDPRGYPLSGASVLFSPVPRAGNTGVLEFLDSPSKTSNSDGMATTTIKLTTPGMASLSANLTDPTLAESSVLKEEAGQMVEDLPREVTRFQPVFQAARVVTGISSDGSLALAPFEPRALGVERLQARRSAEGGVDLKGLNARKAAALTLPQEPRLESGRRAPQPLRRRSPLATATPCEPLFNVAGVEEYLLNAPFSVVVTDLTPSTGQSEENGEVGVEGIHGHRIEKTIRLRIEVKDKDGQVPDHPVLVAVALDGPKADTLILDPNGARLECKRASFLWKPGVPGTQEIEYRLGTYSRYVGPIPDPANPQAVNPVWGVTEQFGVGIFVPLPNGDPDPAAALQRWFGVHPEPGKPESFLYFEATERPVTNVFEFWTGLRNYYDGQRSDGQPKTSAQSAMTNVYFLQDAHENLVWGYTDTQAVLTVAQPNVTITFTSQIANGPDFIGYRLDTTWNDDGPGFVMPSGTMNANLSVTYPTDPDWQGGTVTQPIQLQFISGEMHWLESQLYFYDHRYGVDTQLPFDVSPGGAGGDRKRLTLLALTGIRHLQNHPEYPENNTQIPYIETQAPAQFRLSIVDENYAVVPGAQFRVHRCPLFDHQADPGDLYDSQARTCSLSPLDSVDGILPSPVEINSSSYATNEKRGYLGIELLKAPLAPGRYYIATESVEGNYRIREHSQRFDDRTAAGEFKGAFAFCTVSAIELVDENFTRVEKTLNISIDRQVYVRTVDSSEAADSYQGDLLLVDEDTDQETNLLNIVHRRVGRSATFLTDQIQIVSPDLPLLSLAPGPENLQPAPLTARVAMAGPLAPQPGRYVVKDRRVRGDSTVVTKLHNAMTRLVEFTTATPNFDGITPGREEIEAQVKWGTNGYVSTKLFNVDSDAVFTFDYWQGEPLTTDLRAMEGLPVGTVQVGTRGDLRRFPETGQFQALVGQGETAKPGLYRLRAQWGLNPSSAASMLGDPLCVTDRPQIHVCDNEWIVSVAQRIFLDIEPVALANLRSNLTAVNDPRIAEVFMDDVVQEVTSKYNEASANVLVSTVTNMPRPFMRHLIRDTLTPRVPPFPEYGFTNLDSRFPLVDPDLDLAARSSEGISRDDLYRGPSFGPSGTFVDHFPQQSRNAPPNACEPVNNPCPRDVFFNRFVNVVAHETAHGFGIASPIQYFTHGKPATQATLNAIAAGFSNGSYDEWTPGPNTGSLHEPVLIGFGFGLASHQSNTWLMQFGMLRWRNRAFGIGSAYDLGSPPQEWLVFDRPLRFSLAADYGTQTDQSVQQFFRERVPVCSTRSCR